MKWFDAFLDWLACGLGIAVGIVSGLLLLPFLLIIDVCLLAAGKEPLPPVYRWFRKRQDKHTKRIVAFSEKAFIPTAGGISIRFSDDEG